MHGMREYVYYKRPRLNASSVESSNGGAVATGSTDPRPIALHVNNITTTVDTDVIHHGGIVCASPWSLSSVSATSLERRPFNFADVSSTSLFSFSTSLNAFPNGCGMRTRNNPPKNLSRANFFNQRFIVRSS